MRLDELLEGLETLDHSGLSGEMEVIGATSDSREAGPGMAFFAIRGERADGHQFIQAALDSRATLVFQSDPLDHTRAGSFVRVADSRKAFALVSARLAGHPSRSLRVIGVTGTNGKSSTTLILRHLLNGAGYRAAALGTLGLLAPEDTEFRERGLTTPEAGALQRMLAELRDGGATHLVMEVSSHALSMARVDGVEFAGGVFTNLTQDHLDYHGTLEAYLAAKARLFSELLPQSGGWAVINTDDAAGAGIAQAFSGICVKLGVPRSNNLVISNIVPSPNGLSWETVIKNGVWPPALQAGVNQAFFHSRLIGHYNVYNCLCAAGAALLEGLSLDEVVGGIASFPGVRGRLERVDNTRGVHVFVDYAHTPDALENVLQALRGVVEPGRRIITVMGCGGDRDRMKRPLMGRAAQLGSELTVVTSDNPRTEDPLAIIAEIAAGLDPQGNVTHIEPDRASAIRLAVESAEAGDIVLIAGKGHEDYQLVGDKVLHFSDVEEAAAVLAG